MTNIVELGVVGHWTELDGEWHIIESVSLNGAYSVQTVCGISAPWNQTSVDALPNGPESGHAGCTGADAEDEDEAEEKPKRKAKTKAK